MFQTLPLYVPEAFFKSLDQLVSTFLWDGRVPRESRALLQRFKFEGGLALPNFKYYYFAAHIQKLLCWFHSPKLQSCSVSGSSIGALIAPPLPLRFTDYTGNPLVLSTLRIWMQFRKCFNYVAPSLFLPILENHLFPPGLSDSGFRLWHSRGIKCFRDLYRDRVICSFLQLSSKFDLPAAHLFRYFQIRHCLSSLFSDYVQLPTPLSWDDFLNKNPFEKSFVSTIYSTLLELDGTSVNRARKAWEQELGMVFTDEWWDRAVNVVRCSIPCARLQLIQFKVLHRVHRSRSQLSRFYPDSVRNVCDRCGASPCNLGHMYFFCPVLHGFWDSYFRVTSSALGITLERCPYTAIFGLPLGESSLSGAHVDILSFTFLIARHCVLML